MGCHCRLSSTAPRITFIGMLRIPMSPSADEHSSHPEKRRPVSRGFITYGSVLPISMQPIPGRLPPERNASLKVATSRAFDLPPLSAAPSPRVSILQRRVLIASLAEGHIRRASPVISRQTAPAVRDDNRALSLNLSFDGLCETTATCESLSSTSMTTPSSRLITSWQNLSWCLNLSRRDGHFGRLKKCPEFVFQRVNLRLLQLSGNDIREMPPDIVNLQHLIVLKLDGNMLKALPMQLQDLCNLQVLDVSNNKLSQIEMGVLPPSLLQANFSRNRLSSLPTVDWSSALPKLELFYLQKNQLKSIEGSAMLSLLSIANLRILDLGGNQFSESDGLHLQRSLFHRIRANLLLESESGGCFNFHVSCRDNLCGY